MRPMRLGPAVWELDGPIVIGPSTSLKVLSPDIRGISYHSPR